MPKSLFTTKCWYWTLFIFFHTNSIEIWQFFWLILSSHCLKYLVYPKKIVYSISKLLKSWHCNLLPSANLRVNYHQLFCFLLLKLLTEFRCIDRYCTNTIQHSKKLYSQKIKCILQHKAICTVQLCVNSQQQCAICK